MGWPGARRHGGLNDLDKPRDEQRLVGAVCEGRTCSHREQSGTKALDLFLRREPEVFDVPVPSFYHTQVADRLAISPRTVEDPRAATTATIAARVWRS